MPAQAGIQKNDASGIRASFIYFGAAQLYTRRTFSPST
jgi:hypothetical protein